MIDKLHHIDQQLFLAVHQGMQTEALDQWMPWFRNPKSWLFLYVLFLIYAIYRFKWKSIYILLATALIVLLADQFASGLMKPWIQRLRPCHDPDLAGSVRHLVDCGGLYGFVSSHASNHFGLAVIFSYVFRHLWNTRWINVLFYGWAILICFAQVYVGKHFVGDVLVGGLAGWAIGSLIVNVLKTRFIKNR